MTKTNYPTEQEMFWSGKFGDNYVERNNTDAMVDSSVALFDQIMKSTNGVNSIIELGCNTGLNLRALQLINPKLELTGYDINEKSLSIARASTEASIINATIIGDLTQEAQVDLTFTKTVLIHINPDFLQNVYDNLFKLSKRYIMVAEYYNPYPVKVPYRDNSDKLFKRDFAGELIDRFGLKLADYGFVYHRDVFPQDDITWFLLEK